MSDFPEDSSGRYRYARRSFLGPLAYDRWGMFWMGWIFAAFIAQWFDAPWIGLVGVIAIAIISVRASLSGRGLIVQSETTPVSGQQTPPSIQVEQPRDQPIGGIRYVFRGAALWLVLALLFLLIVKIFSRAN
jgi:hypothetical protein